MNDILKTLYYVELEENEILSQNREMKSGSAYDNLLHALSDEQKTLFFAYEAENNAANCDYGRLVYRCAFQSAFRLAFDILKNA